MSSIAVKKRKYRENKSIFIIYYFNYIIVFIWIIINYYYYYYYTENQVNKDLSMPKNKIRQRLNREKKSITIQPPAIKANDIEHSIIIR
jgi:hypothetical protein